MLSYYTTNREGYREYRSDGQKCAGCPHLGKCTESKDHVKTVTRHVWAEYLEEAEENRYIPGIREYYPKRQETIERCFGLAKELHGFRYTQEYGRARMEVKAALTFACMNLKKLAKRRWKLGWKALHAALFWLFACIHMESRFMASAMNRDLSTV